MRGKWPVLTAVFAAGVVYVAYPYIALYQLGTAIRSADAATLETMVDWYSVREGIKEDVCDLGLDSGANADALPEFGASFVRGIASSQIDRAVTPQAVLAAVNAAPAQPRGPDVHVNWAFFDGLASFLVSLQAPGQPDPIKIGMTLRRGVWHVHRVWLPDAMLGGAAPGYVVIRVAARRPQP